MATLSNTATAACMAAVVSTLMFGTTLTLQELRAESVQVCEIGGCQSFDAQALTSAASRAGAANWSPDVIWGHVEEILQVTGLAPNFKLAATEEVGNAAAWIHPEERVRYLLYNPHWIKSIDSSQKWPMYGLISHEIGHHLQGHTLDGQGSTPPTELQADSFAGFVLGRLGATSEQATALWITLPPLGSDTHPPRDDRLAAVRDGWQRGGGQVASAPPEPEPDYILSQSNQRRIDPSELTGFSPARLRLARNEIFARYGYAFRSQDLQAYFGTKSWYRRGDRNVTLNSVEKYNVDLIKRLEDQGGGASEPAADDYVIAHSNAVRLTPSELEGFSAAQLRIARNEIYARHGYIFNSPDLREYFSRKPWYAARTRNVSLSAIEDYNVALIRRLE